MNRLTQHLAAITPTLPEPREPRNGELVYGMMLWRACKGSTWRPTNVDAVPPFTAGRFTIIWSIARDLPPVLREVLESNKQSLKDATERSGRVKTWSVPVRAVCGFDETARIVETAKGGAL